MTALFCNGCIVHRILLKGNGLAEIAFNLWPIDAFVIAAGIVAMLRYRADA